MIIVTISIKEESTGVAISTKAVAQDATKEEIKQFELHRDKLHELALEHNNGLYRQIRRDIKPIDE